MEEIRICAFIDSLGTREIITQENVTKRIQLIELIKSLSDRTTDYSDNAENLGGAVVFRQSAQSTTFSDNIAISIPLKQFQTPGIIGQNKHIFRTSASMFFNDLIAQIVISVWDALKLGILFRGGISVGNLVHDKKIIVGEALVKAVELEKETRYPRIEISPEILELLDEGGQKIVEDYIKDSCIQFYEGKWIINTLDFHNGYWRDHNWFREQNGEQPEEINVALNKISKTLADEYIIILSSKSSRAIENWDKFFEHLEYTFKNGRWKDFNGAYESMFLEINKVRN